MACSIANSVAALLVLAVAAVARPALAAEPTPDERTLAQSLFDEGRRLMDAGRYDQACTRFADSQRLDPGGGTVLNLALCYEKLGALARAYGTYNEALSFAITERRREREQFARERIAALGARLPHLVLRVHDPQAGLDVQLDGSPVPSSVWGVATAVDPGTHTVDAVAPGSAPFRAILTFEEGQTRELDVALQPERPQEPVRTGPVWHPPPPTHKTAAFYALGGLAVASAGASIVTGILAWSAHQSVQGECNPDRGYCSSPSGPDDASRARTMAWVSTVTLAGAVVAGTLALVLPLSAPDTATVSLAPWPGPGLVLSVVR